MDEKRLDEELNTTLQELRVKLPGVQILFAFLLMLPFSEGFRLTNAVEKGTYLGDMICTALASVFLIAPAVYHRIHWRCVSEEKDHMLRVMNKLAIVGSVFLSLAMVTSIFLVADYVFGRTLGLVATAGVSVVLIGAWYALPLLSRAKHGHETSRGAGRFEAGASR
ncbi:MAG: hypothetical protein JNK82_44570 [Myxococcaceae bacterium]|nr:hypothetical protein [Myxococcaceae bacterium]